nr:hypothetical protein GCM10017745_41220 [Saccharothrix mutabilis subsp. capreolus]
MPLGLAKLVRALLDPDPAARPDDVRAELDKITGPVGPPAPSGRRVQVAEAKPLPDTDRRDRLGLVLGVAAALALFAAAPFLLLRDDPPAPSPQVPAVSAPQAPRIEVTEVRDDGDHVTITWTARTWTTSSSRPPRASRTPPPPSRATAPPASPSSRT